MKIRTGDLGMILGEAGLFVTCQLCDNNILCLALLTEKGIGLGYCGKADREIFAWAL